MPGIFSFFSSCEPDKATIDAEIKKVKKRGDMINVAQRIRKSKLISPEDKNVMFVSLIYKWVARTNDKLQKKGKILTRIHTNGSKELVPLQVAALSLTVYYSLDDIASALMQNVYDTVFATFKKPLCQGGEFVIGKRLYDEFIDLLLSQASKFLHAICENFTPLSINDCYHCSGRLGVVRLKSRDEILSINKSRGDRDVSMEQF